MVRLDQLATISESPRHLTRRCFTPEHRQINDLTGTWMRDASMTVHEDAVGNVIGRYEGLVEGAPAIMLGSHLDTVIMAGKYDGGLGILAAIDCVRSLHRRGIQFDHAIEIAGFADEEGVRFQSTYLGSRALAGTFDTALLNRPDKDGVTLAEAMQEFGLDPGRIGEAVRRTDEFLCYLEVHIEQGPVLESEGLAVGAVTAISGANRMTVTLDGTAGHAGTVPMPARHDALIAASECVLAVEEIAASYAGMVGTVGQMTVSPGATNVIPGRTTFSVDMRAPKDDLRRAAVAELEARMRDLAARRSVSISIEATHEATSVACAPWIIDEIEEAMTELGHRPFRLPSGAGHDAAAMAEITDVGMIFVRCAGGISHSPDESITGEDAVAGAHLLLRVVENIGAKKS
jgi:allantoate deiminase